MTNFVAVWKLLLEFVIVLNEENILILLQIIIGSNKCSLYILFVKDALSEQWMCGLRLSDWENYSTDWVDHSEVLPLFISLGLQFHLPPSEFYGFRQQLEPSHPFSSEVTTK